MLTRPLIGDFNEDGRLSADDIDLLTENLFTSDPLFDVNSNGIVDGHDIRIWVEEIADILPGDSNVDGEFNSSDLVQVFQAGKFELPEDIVVSWTEGDWNFDQKFASSDIVVAFTAGGYEAGPRKGTLVPEPNDATPHFWLCFVLIAWFPCRSTAQLTQ